MENKEVQASIKKSIDDPIHFIETFTNFKLYPSQKELIRTIKKNEGREIYLRGSRVRTI